MRKGVVAGLSGVVCVAAMSCGEEVENPDIVIPESIKSASTALAMRITGPYGPNDDYIVETLGRMLNDNISFVDFVTRGGMPEGPLTANPAGSAPEQIKAFFDNGGALAADEALDACGNPMVAAFVTPNMVQSILPGEATPTSQPSWPGVCAADLNCDTTKQGKWEVGFSKDHGDGSRDLVLVLSPQAGPLTQPAFQGHLISFMLTGNTTGAHLLTAALYGNARSVTVSAFGLVKFVKAGISTRPTAPLPGLPTRVWAFPAEERELAGADLIVGVQPYEFCPDSWALAFGGAAEPLGCAAQKSLVYDVTSAQGRTQWEETDSGEDIEKAQALQTDVDDIIKAWEYQLKAQIACPDVSEPNWIRQDIALGSVEIFQCPDGDVDRCIAYHDMEDYWCELPGDEEPGGEFEAVLPHWEHAAAHPTFSGDFVADVPAGTRQTVIYSVNGVEKTITWTLAHDSGASEETPITITAVAAHLNSRMTALGFNDIDLFVENDKIVVEPAVDLGPVGTFAWGSGTLNSRLSLTGNAGTTSPTLPSAGESPYLVTATNTTLDVAYVKVSGTPEEPLAIYADEPARILGLTDSSGNTITLPTPRTDGHCEGEGAVVFEITGANQYLKLDLTTDSTDDIRLLASSVPDYL